MRARASISHPRSRPVTGESPFERDISAFRQRGLAFALVAVLISVFSGLSHGMPFRPDVLKTLKSKGRLRMASRLEEDARRRGMDRPKPWIKLRREASGGMAAQSLTALVLLVDFSDNIADTLNYPSVHFEEMLFSSGAYPTGSANDYYQEVSRGKLSLAGTVIPWFRLTNTYAYYVAGKAGLGSYPFNAQALVEEAVQKADPFVDYSRFDNDGPDGIPNSGDDDGLVDALLVFHAGPGREETGSSNDIHSHQWTTSVPVQLDGVWVYPYSIQPINGTIGVVCHEMGHLLGLPDLYDTDYSSCGVGYWSIMAAGSWGGPPDQPGTKPVHFDAWCKAKLGFVPAVVPNDNQPLVSLDPVESGGEVYKVWKNGRPEKEYFLAEYRAKTGFDGYVRGEGLMIYHVDETVGTNDDESHYLVDVEEADGNEDLVHCTDQGDAGDPFPGSSGNHEFSKTTTPSTWSNGLEPTQVAFAGIDTSLGRVVFSLQVEDEPSFVWEAPVVVDSLGNSDGGLDPGETVRLSLRMRNVGTASAPLTGTVELVGEAGLATLLNDICSFDSVAADSIGASDTAIVLQLDPLAPDPYGLELRVVLVDPSFDFFEVRGILVAGDSVGLVDAFESGAAGWSHSSASVGYSDEWHLSTQRNHTPGGSYAFKCGDTGSGDYAVKDDAALVSPWLSVGENSILRFYYWIDAEVMVPGLQSSIKRAWDGGVVEVTSDGENWERVVPVGGYPFAIEFNPDSRISGERAYSGLNSGWQQAVFDLSSYQGPLRVRFRFCSDGSVGGEGWYVDDVEVLSGESSIDEGLSPAGPGADESRELVRGFPNPFNPDVQIEYSLPRRMRVELSVFDVSGSLVKVLFAGESAAGSHLLRWDGTGERGRRCGTGVYFLRLESEGGSDVVKVTLLR